MSDESWTRFVGPQGTKYPTPADVPGGVPIPPGHDAQLPDWLSWGKAWRAYYDTTEPKERETPADGRPVIPPPRSSDEDWKKFGEEISAWYKARGE